MSDHIIEWLGAYHDGELHGKRLQQVEQHLADCSACRAELDEIRSLSFLLSDTQPDAEFIPTDRFVANLVLGMPRRPETPPASSRFVQTGWWLVPVGLLLAMFFVNITLSLSSAASLASNSGLFGAGLPWAQEGSLQMGWFIRAMDLFGSRLSGPGQSILSIVNEVNVFIAQLVRPLIPQVLLAAGYLGWLLAWWLRSQESHTTQPAHRSS